MNAFALPGGIIVVNAGTVLRSDRPEMLLGVLAHELSHVTERHTTRQAITVFGLYVVVDLMFGSMFGTVAAVSQGAMYLLQQGFSRESEEEADTQGLAYLEKAKIDPMGMVEFFKLMQQEYEENPVVATLDSSLNFLSTHPAVGERIEYLTARIQSSGSSAVAPLPTEEFERFKAKLRSKL